VKTIDIVCEELTSITGDDRSL